MSNELSLDHRVYANLLFGKRRTEALYKAQKSGLSRIVREPASRFFEALSDLRVAALVPGIIFLTIALCRALIIWGDKLAGGSPVDAEDDAMEVAVGIALSAYVLWLLGSGVRHISGPEHRDPVRLQAYFDELEQLIPDHHDDKDAVLNPGNDSVACKKFHVFHSRMIEYLFVVEKNPRAAAFVITAVRRRVQHAPMDLDDFAQLSIPLAWDSLHDVRLSLGADLSDSDTDTGEAEENAEDEVVAAVDFLGGAAALLNRQQIIRRLLLKSMPGHTVAERRQALDAALVEGDEVGPAVPVARGAGYRDRGLGADAVAARPGVSSAIQRLQAMLGGGESPATILRLNAVLRGESESGVASNPMPARFATFLATIPLPNGDDLDGEPDVVDEEVSISVSLDSAGSSQLRRRRFRVVDHFSYQLHEGEDAESPHINKRGQRMAELKTHHVASREARERPHSYKYMPSLDALNYPRGYLAEYVIADAGHHLRQLKHPHLQPRFEWLGYWFHYGRQRCGVTSLDQEAYDRARLMRQTIERLLKYRGPFEAEVAGRPQEQTLFDRALMFALLLRDMKQLDDWQHWSQVGVFEHAVFKLLPTDKQVKFIFTLMSGPPFTQLLARALVHDNGKRHEHGVMAQVHAGFSHTQLNKFFKAYLAFMDQPVPGETPRQTDLRLMLFVEQLVFLTDGCQGNSQQDGRMMAYCQSHTKKPLKMLAHLVRRLAPLVPSYMQEATLVDSTGTCIELKEADLRAAIGAHTEQADWAILLAGIDTQNALRVQQRLSDIQTWCAAGSLVPADPVLPDNITIEMIMDATRRMEAREKCFAVRYIKTHRAAINRAVQLFAMLDEVRRQQVIIELSAEDPLSVLPFFSCDTAESFAVLQTMLPIGSRLMLLGTLLSPLLPERHRHVWHVLMTLLDKNAGYTDDVNHFIDDHADIMLTLRSLDFAFELSPSIFKLVERQQGFAFFIMKKIVSCPHLLLHAKASQLDHLLGEAFPDLSLPAIAQQLAAIINVADATVLSEALDLVVRYRISRSHSRDEVVQLLAEDEAALAELMQKAVIDTPSQLQWLPALLKSWLLHDRAPDYHAHALLAGVCQVHPNIAHSLVLLALQALPVTAEQARCQPVIDLLDQLATNDPAEFGADAFKIARLLEIFRIELGDEFDVKLALFIRHQPYLIWGVVRVFVRDPADVLVAADYRADQPEPAHLIDWQRAASTIYDLLSDDRNAAIQPIESVLLEMINQPDCLRPEANQSPDLGFLLTQLIKLDQMNDNRKALVISRLYAAYVQQLKADIDLRDVPEIPHCPSHLQPHFDAFMQRFYSGYQWPGQDSDLRTKIWRQFAYGMLSLNWQLKAWRPVPQSMLTRVLLESQSALRSFIQQYTLDGRALSGLDDARTRCAEAVDALFDIYLNSVNTAPEQVGDYIPVDNQAGAAFGADEQSVVLGLLIDLLRLPKPQTDNLKERLVTTYIKLIHIFLSAQMIVERQFKAFYREVMPRLMRQLRPLDFNHHNDPLLLSDLWVNLPASLQLVNEHDGPEVEQRRGSTLVKQRLSLAYMCWRYDLSRGISSVSRFFNSTLNKLSCGGQSTYIEQDAEWIQGMRDRFFHAPEDVGQALGTSEHCRVWLRGRLAFESQRPRLQLRNEDLVERGELAPLLDGPGGIN